MSSPFTPITIVADQNQPQVADAFAAFGEVILLPAEKITNASLRSADALICRSTLKVNEELLRDTRVKFVGSCVVGENHLDRQYLATRNIVCAIAAGCNANSVGEYLTAALLTYAVERKSPLAGKTLGIIGVGNVGGDVARKAKTLGMNVLLNDPPRAQNEKIGDAENFVDLSELLRAADFVSLHVPLIMDGKFATYRLADDNFFATMKRGAVFINTSRGKAVDEDALIRAIGKGQIESAICDVYAGEPRPREDFIKRLFLATPHIAGHSYDGKINGTKMIRDFAAEFFGVKEAWSPAPPPEDFFVSRIAIESDAADEIEILDAVNAVYDIRADHENFRAAPHRFAEIRAHYPVRREFHHTVITAPSHRPTLAKILRDLGFSVETPNDFSD